MIEISSSSNEHFKRWKDLDSSRGIRKHGEFFLMGEKLIREFLKNPRYKIKAEIIFEGQTALCPSHPQAVRFGKTPLFKLSKNLFNEIDFVGTHFNLLVLELPEIENWDKTSRPSATPFQDLSRPQSLDKPQNLSKPQGLQVISPLGDPANLGALARSALAFGAKSLILTEESAHPFLPKAIKASAGALLTLPLKKAGKLNELALGLENLYALDMEGQDVSKFQWPQDLFLLVGEEGPGLASLKIKNKLRVPTGPVESLNATVAASIALYGYAVTFPDATHPEK